VVRYVVTGKLWDEARVTLETAEGTLRSLPVGWTDLLPADPVGGEFAIRVLSHR
jgi:hypothetical protein